MGLFGSNYNQVPYSSIAINNATFIAHDGTSARILARKTLDVLEKSNILTDKVQATEPFALTKDSSLNIGVALRAGLEVDRLCLQHAHKLYGESFSVETGLRDRGFKSFFRKAAELQKCSKKFCKTIAEKETKFDSKNKMASLSLVANQHTDRCVVEIFVRIEARREINFCIPFLAGYKKEKVVGPEGVIPLLACEITPSGVTNLLPEFKEGTQQDKKLAFSRTEHGAFTLLGDLSSAKFFIREVTQYKFLFFNRQLHRERFVKVGSI